MTKPRELTLPDVAFIVAVFVFLIPLGIALLDYAQAAIAALGFIYPLDYGEGPILDQVARLAHFENIYRPGFSMPPYTVSNDPPLFQLIQAPFARLFGPAFWYGRAVSILSALASALFIALILHRLTGDWIASIIGGLTLLVFPHIAYWSALDRVDTLALALSLGGLFAVVRWPDRQAGWVLALVLFTLAIYTRQTYALAAPLTAFLWLWQAKQRRQAFTLIGLLALLCLALFLTLNVLTQGGFHLNIIAANSNVFSWYRVIDFLINLGLHASLIIIGVALYLVLERTGEHTRAWPFVLAYLVSALLVSFMAGQAGSNVNYLYELVAALCFGVGAAIAWLGDSRWLKVGAILVLALQINGLSEWSREEHLARIDEKVGNRREIALLSDLVRQSQAPVLADEFMGLLPLNGRRVYFQPFEYKQLEEAGQWNNTELVEQIQRREFPAILLYEPIGQPATIVTRWTPEIRNAIYDNYEREALLAGALVYLPKPK
jgi:hypothetical protein